MISVTPVAAMWFTVYNPCPVSDNDCLQCKRVKTYPTPPGYPYWCNLPKRCTGYGSQPGVCKDDVCDTTQVPCDATQPASQNEPMEIGKPCRCTIEPDFRGKFGYCEKPQQHQCRYANKTCNEVSTCASADPTLSINLPCKCNSVPNFGKYGTCMTSSTTGRGVCGLAQGATTDC